MKKYFLLLFICAALSSCFKDEPLNAECDILTAEVVLDDWSQVFYNETDTRARINEDYASSTIKFSNTLPDADLTAMAPIFTISEGASITPESGTVLDFSQGGQEYTVRSASGKWERTYTVRFTHPSSETEFHFEDYSLSEDGKFYEWGGDWSTANPGFSIANGGADPEEYPTVPDPNGVEGSCVRLTTSSTGTWGALVEKPLAAGNLFLGEFDVFTALVSTLESTHFGVPFNQKPVRFCGWYKYSPGSQITDRYNNVVAGQDEAAIYARLYRNHDDEGNAFTLDGNDVKTNPYIIGAAEVETRVTGEWLYFDVPFEYSEEIDYDILDTMGYSLVIAFCSSRDGNIYQGAIGSTLYIDEVRIVVEGEEDDDSTPND